MQNLYNISQMSTSVCGIYLGVRMLVVSHDGFCCEVFKKHTCTLIYIQVVEFQTQ